MRWSRFIKGAAIVSMASALVAVPLSSAFGSVASGSLTVTPDSVVAGSTTNFQVTYTDSGGGGVKCVIFTLTDFTPVAGSSVLVAPTTGWTSADGPGANQVTVSGNPAIGTGLSATITVDATAPAAPETTNWVADAFTDTDCTKPVFEATSGTITVTPASPGGGPCHCQPDMLIRLAHHTKWKGDNIYSGTGLHESIKVAAHAGQTWVVFLKGENDGTAPDNITISGLPSRPFIKVHYFHGTTNITGQVVNHVYVQDLAPGGHTLLRMVVHLLPGVRAGVTRVFPVEGRSGIDFTKRDVVKFKLNIFKV